MRKVKFLVFMTLLFAPALNATGMAREMCTLCDTSQLKDTPEGKSDKKESKKPALIIYRDGKEVEISKKELDYVLNNKIPSLLSR